MKKYIISEQPNLFKPNAYISMIVKIKGNIAVDKATKAVQTAYNSNESTMSKIALEENGSAY